MKADHTPLMHHRPLAGMTEQARIDMMRTAGALVPSTAYRIGIDAMVIRDDVSINDSLESVRLALRRADALLVMLECEDAGDDTPMLTGLARDLVRMAQGSVAVIAEGIHAATTGAADAVGTASKVVMSGATRGADQ